MLSSHDCNWASSLRLLSCSAPFFTNIKAFSNKSLFAVKFCCARRTSAINSAPILSTSTTDNVLVCPIALLKLDRKLWGVAQKLASNIKLSSSDLAKLRYQSWQTCKIISVEFAAMLALKGKPLVKAY